MGEEEGGVKNRGAIEIPIRAQSELPGGVNSKEMPHFGPNLVDVF